MRFHLAGIPLALGVSLLVVAAPLHAQGKWQSSTESSGTRYLNYDATVMLLGNPTPITMAFYCSTAHTKTESGALGFDLSIQKVAQLAPFHFDDFEGPDAPSAEKRLMKLTIVRKGKVPLTFELSPSGAYPHIANFVFGVADVTHLPKSDSKTILRALSEGAESVQITITDSRNPKVKLDLTIPVAGKQADFRTLLTGVK